MRRIAMAAPKTRRFTRDEYRRMGEVGILREDDRTELIDGEILLMAAIGPRHSSAVAGLTHAFAPLHDRAILWVQNPVAIDEYSEPVPDFSLLEKIDDFYRTDHPDPASMLLAAEVSDTTRAFDLGVKLPLYARAGIREFWLVDIRDGVIRVCREPGPEGYGRIAVAERGQTVAAAAFPEHEVRVEAILG